MHTIFILLFCATLTLIGADYSFDLDHRLIHPNRPELSNDLTLKPFWQELRAVKQEQKDDALLKASTTDDFIDQYSKKTRKDIAAIVYVGANVAAVQYMQDQIIGGRRLLPDVVLMHDIPLARILIEHGADVHQKTYNDETAIYNAQTVAIAQLLIAHRALDDLTKDQKAKLMHKVMEPDYDPQLITLYKENGVYLAPSDYNDTSPLISLVRIPQNYMNTKARLFLNGYGKQERLDLLTIPKIIDIDGELFNDVSGYTVFDIIEEQKKDAHEVHVDRLNDLHDCLLKEIGEKCSICPELLNLLDAQSFIKTDCGHLFCLTCLNDRGSGCPLCPSKLMYYAKGAAIVVGAAVIIGGVVYLIKSRSEMKVENTALREASYAVISTSKESSQAVYELGFQAGSNLKEMTPVSVTTLASTTQANVIMPSMKGVNVGVIIEHNQAIGRLETLLDTAKTNTHTIKKQ